VVATIVDRLEQRLPRDVYVLQAGLVLNAFGNGTANPFLLLYLHNVRHIPLAEAGLASAASAFCALLASLAGGSVADKLGPKASVLGGLAIAAATFAAYPLVTTGWQAILFGALLGTAAGGWLTGQTALVAAIVPADKRHIAFAQQRVAANVGLGLGGLCGGLIVSTSSVSTFTVLFLVNAASFAVYGLFVARVRVPPVVPINRAQGFRDVLRDRVVLRVLALDAAVVAGAVALLNGLVPVYARNVVGSRGPAIGALFLLNSLLIIGAQLPVAKAVEGKRRARALSLMAALFALCWLLVLAAGYARWGYVLLLAGIVALSFGECIYDTVRTPLIANLAPEGLMGRYLAAAGFSWQLGFIIGPAVGAALLGADPPALWIAAASLCALAAVGALRLDARLPADVRVTARRGKSGRE
jgi:MFS family permease